MTEQKIYEGVYFTDYRQNSAAKLEGPACAPKMTPYGITSTGDPGDTQFITFDQLKQIKDTSKLSYLLTSILNRHHWLCESTEFMLHDRELWSDPDVREAIEENMPLVARYMEMLEWILTENSHAAEKAEEDKCKRAKDRSEALLKVYETFKQEQGLEL